eukprot:161646-Amphidinium_carterae.1
MKERRNQVDKLIQPEPPTWQVAIVRIVWLEINSVWMIPQMWMSIVTCQKLFVPVTLHLTALTYRYPPCKTQACNFMELEPKCRKA